MKRSAQAAQPAVDPILSAALGDAAAQLSPELADRVAEALRASAAPAANAPLPSNPHCEPVWPSLHSHAPAHRLAADLQRASIAALTLGRLLQCDAELTEGMALGDDMPPLTRWMTAGLHHALAIALNQIEVCAEEIYMQASTEAGE